MKKVLITIVIGLSSLALTAQVYATDRFMATTGADSGDCSSEASPCLTLQYAMINMSGGDTLYIEDGNYTSSGNTIDQFNVPPSGEPGAFTVIRAKNIPCQNGTSCDQPLRVAFSGNAKFQCTNNNKVSTYVKFFGIRWNGISTYTGWDHIYFKQVASQGVVDGNSATITIAGQNNLLEDVIAFGKGRYKLLFYDISRESQTNGDGNNICRRCVVRHDWAMRDDSSPQPIAGIASYYNRGTACLNCIVIDSDTPSEWQDNPTELSGAFYQPVDSGTHAFIVKGSLVINTALSVLANTSGSTGNIIKDVVGIKTAGGFFLRGQTDVDNVTLVDVGVNNFTYRSTTQESKVLGRDDGKKLYSGDGPVSLDNSIISDTADDGVDGKGVASNNINMFQIGGSNYVGSTQASNLITTDPLLTGLKHPVRIEAGSTLATQGSGGGRIGANIVNKLGVDGTFKGNTNWDTEQGTLWPWPLEAWIKAEMKTSEYTTDADRGFCAAGTALYGGNITLTSYIWEFLGNPCPEGICTTLSSPQNLRKKKVECENGVCP